MDWGRGRNWETSLFHCTLWRSTFHRSLAMSETGYAGDLKTFEASFWQLTISQASILDIFLLRAWLCPLTEIYNGTTKINFLIDTHSYYRNEPFIEFNWAQNNCNGQRRIRSCQWEWVGYCVHVRRLSHSETLFIIITSNFEINRDLYASSILHSCVCI